ncbi:MAG: hypothetical protein QOF63_617 [Thermoanaerobaculia bacterium]|jgi:hypothetical protein|nr:hypothetical protein [Thermoanaerobaculia bacterium]
MSYEMVQTLPEVDDVATQAVRRLDIKDFIDTNLDALYEKLKEADRGAPDDDVRFAASSEQMMRTIIYFMSGRKDALDAMAWVGEQWKGKTRDPNPMTILSMLALQYLEEEGMKHSDSDQIETWRRFRARLAAGTEKDADVVQNDFFASLASSA